MISPGLEVIGPAGVSAEGTQLGQGVGPLSVLAPSASVPQGHVPPPALRGPRGDFGRGESSLGVEAGWACEMQTKP